MGEVRGDGAVHFGDPSSCLKCPVVFELQVAKWVRVNRRPRKRKRRETEEVFEEKLLCKGIGGGTKMLVFWTLHVRHSFRLGPPTWPQSPVIVHSSGARCRQPLSCCEEARDESAEPSQRFGCKAESSRVLHVRRRLIISPVSVFLAFVLPSVCVPDKEPCPCYAPELALPKPVSSQQGRVPGSRSATASRAGWAGSLGAPGHIAQSVEIWIECQADCCSHGAMINQENRWAYICAVLCPSAILHVKRFTEVILTSFLTEPAFTECDPECDDSVGSVGTSDVYETHGALCMKVAPCGRCFSIWVEFLTGERRNVAEFVRKVANSSPDPVSIPEIKGESRESRPRHWCGRRTSAEASGLVSGTDCVFLVDAGGSVL
ncbi:hypothetical protein CB1_000978023 [Camelus ferus]|nr:hypothetical protein CB1_000978023 [Camelus ferus]